MRHVEECLGLAVRKLAVGEATLSERLIAAYTERLVHVSESEIAELTHEDSQSLVNMIKHLSTENRSELSEAKARAIAADLFDMFWKVTSSAYEWRQEVS